MMERRRGPGRPAYDSKQKLVAATCKLLSERGFEATSPQMFSSARGRPREHVTNFLAEGRARAGRDQSHASQHSRVPRRQPHT